MILENKKYYYKIPSKDDILEQNGWPARQKNRKKKKKKSEYVEKWVKEGPELECGWRAVQDEMKEIGISHFDAVIPIIQSCSHWNGENLF